MRTYDELGRITKITYPDGNDIDFVYNAGGKVVQRTDQRGIVTTYSYDGVYNMLSKIVYGNGVTDDAEETFTYDGLGRMLTATKVVDSATVSETEFAYNDIGKITDSNEALFGGTKREIDYSYDQAGFLTSTSYPTGHDVNVTPDWAGRIDTIELGALPPIASYKYIGSRVAQRHYTMPGITYQPSYDNLGRIVDANSGTSYARFTYQYDPNTNNISKMTYDHAPGEPCTVFSYDNLDRLTVAEYGVDETNEVFTMDDLGNRDAVNVRDGNTIDYVIDANTNQYTSVGDANLTYDAAGNLTVDKDGYEYDYDYENRIVKITKDPNNTVVAEFAYDALGRRVKKYDAVANETTLYYNNYNWQVLCEYNDSNVPQRIFIYGNYIDEVLVMSTPVLFFYVHDHLYSPAALVYSNGIVFERYEYDAYGNCLVLEPNFAPDPDGQSDYGNPYLFTGRRVDVLDRGSLKIQYSRNRYYDYYTGRWFSQDAVGYIDTLNLCEYASSNPVVYSDPYGLWVKKEIISGEFIDRSFTMDPAGTDMGGYLTMEYEVEIKYGCTGPYELQTETWEPKVNSYNLVWAPDSPGFSIIVVGFEVPNWVQINEHTLSLNCPQGKTGTKLQWDIDIIWMHQLEVGICIGIGPIGIPVWTWELVPKEKMKTSRRIIIDCCYKK